MNRAKIIKKSAVFATIGLLLLSLIPIANAGVPGHFEDRPFYNNLLMPWATGNFDWEFSTSEELFFRIGWALSEEELANDWAPENPWQFKLFINDEEINLQRYDVEPDETSGIVKMTVWYHIFGPGYFEAEGEYLLRFEFWVRKPYQGDGLNYWRIFVDYGGILTGVPGLEFNFEYYLNIVE